MRYLSAMVDRSFRRAMGLPDGQEYVNADTGRSVASEEMSKADEFPLHLSENQRDLLLRNGRQDIAHAALNTMVTLQELRLIKRLLLLTIGLLALVLVGAVYTGLRYATL